MRVGETAGRHVRLALVSASLFTLASLASELVASQASGLTSLWLANGLLLGLLVAVGRDRGEQAAIVIGALAGNLLSSILRGQPPILIALFPVANLAEAIIAAALLRVFGGISGAFERVSDVAALGAACAIAPIFSAAAGAAALHLATGAPFGEGWLNWYRAAALSLAVVAPAVIVLARFSERLAARTMPAHRIAEVIVILGLVAAAAVGIFYATRLPVLFLMPPFVLLATFRLRQFGAVAAIIIIAIVSARATGEGFGPIATHAGGPAEQILLLQFFLMVTFLSSLPVAAALSQSDRSGEEAHLIADHFKTVVENIGEVIFRTDRQGRWTYLNPAWQELSGYPVAESTGRSWLDWLDPGERDEFREWSTPVLDGRVQATRRLLRFHTASGEIRWMELSIRALLDIHRHVIGTTGTLRDIDDRKRLEEHVMSAKRRAEEQAREATMLAATDELTGLANRRAFLRHLDRQVQAANEFGWALAVAIFDVDHFKVVNDSHGHAVGDRVLQLVASRSVGVVRSGDLVGRLGGEEFAILMPGASPADAAAVAERLRLIIGRPEADEMLGGMLPCVTVSVGIAAHAGGQGATDLLAGADGALYEAKSDGRNRVKLAA